ncbi:MAG: PAS domain S-box protein [Thiobacillus sp.]|jgi:PAS domain S-box-containing protein|uniref:sensor histidine kinase n=1 Tax=Thiobacillus sp. TaxID=924 RepID=UPI00289588BB|nr:PAS domain S-box protein [Thiobacillus sp.]MDT3705354.1 PAS domain S-box protein [Thiobacillus sp.]
MNKWIGMKRWTVETQVLVGFGLAISVLAVVGASLYRTTVGFIDTSAAVARSQQTLTTLESIYSLISQAESRQRVYLLLGDEINLAPREAAVARMNALVAELGQLTTDDPQLRAHLPEFRQRIADRMAMLDAVLEARRRGGFEAGQQQLAASPGRDEMRKLNELVVFMQGELSTRLEQRQQAAQESARRTLAMLGLLLVLVVVALAALYARIRREALERRKSEERLRAVVDTAVDAIITIDASGLIESFNPAASRLFGYTAAEMIGRNVSQLMPEPDRSRHDGYLHRYLKSGERHIIGVGREVTAQHKDGSRIPIGLAVSEMRLGEQRLFTGILHDLTLRKRAEARQAELIDDLQAANEELKNFAYVVSHDLKAPLRGIGSLSDWLLSDYADKIDDQGREYLTLMKNRVSRMDALIDGILEYSRVGRINETRVAVDLNGLVAEVIQLLAPPAEVTVTIEGPLPTVVGERTRLQQVFQNLISNAIKHRDKPEGRIRIACADAGSAWQLSIADNGPGIEARHHERIFQLFQVLTPRDQKESTGVGLALVKKIIELYGGRVWLESQPDAGSTFFFTLPKAGA